MKMLKKLLAIVLTGAMALTLLTACGGNAVTEKSIADAMTDMAKAEGKNITFTPPGGRAGTGPKDRCAGRERDG